jgi:hypothetical protein
MHVDAGIGSDLCRVTVIAPGARIDVALPVHVSFAELMPTFVRQTGTDPVNDPSQGNGWSLQRFGQPPLDTGLTPAALSILDGEVLYLRPRQAELPELAFYDVADAVATATSGSTRRGRCRHPGPVSAPRWSPSWWPPYQLGAAGRRPLRPPSPGGRVRLTTHRWTHVSAGVGAAL